MCEITAPQLFNQVQKVERTLFEGGIQDQNKDDFVQNVLLFFQALAWTDGRYFLQASEQLDCNWELMKMGQPDVLTYTEFLSQLPSGSIVACDPKLMGAKTWITLKEKLSEVGVNLTSLSQNLIDEVWTEDNGRPPANVRFAKFSWFFVRIPFGIL